MNEMRGVCEEEKLAIELEFVQCLANPAYLSFLAQEGYFDDSKFVAYLAYLLYMKRAEYAILLSYPNGLVMLELLQDESFRKQLKDPDCVTYIHRQQFYQWLNYHTADDK